jgi:hypothetical protein
VKNFKEFVVPVRRRKIKEVKKVTEIYKVGQFALLIDVSWQMNKGEGNRTVL